MSNKDYSNINPPPLPSQVSYSPQQLYDGPLSDDEYDEPPSSSLRPVSPLPAVPNPTYSPHYSPHPSYSSHPSYSYDDEGADIYAGQEETYPLREYPAAPGTADPHTLFDYASPSPVPNQYSYVQGASYPLNTYDNEEDDAEEEYTDDEDLQAHFDNQDYGHHDILASDTYAPTTAPPDEYYQDEQPDEELPPPGQQPRRQMTMTTKRVRLFRGNLVLDCPVASELLSRSPNKTEREFTHMRYSAATTTPTDFPNANFTLRQRLYDPNRETELFIVVTIYNEDDILLARTLKGVFENIYHFCNLKASKPGGDVWGPDGWKKIVVCVVADGRDKINPRARALMSALGCYQDGVAVNAVDDKLVTAHLYEYTTQFGISATEPTVSLAAPDQSSKHRMFPVQLLFAIKEQNAKKINSHRWFFDAFGTLLTPNVCVLLDAGTKPGSDSLYHLWYEFHKDRSVGGACGEIRADLGRVGKNLLNPLVAAQNFEYKMSNILDKPLESAFGFISVLPGAFSAYRYSALQNDVNGQGPLEKYFKGETLHDSNAGIFTSNMYLAEDRILCFELVSKRGASWMLRYVKSAHAETDVPDKLAELVLQRRRWLNGSFFAALYSLTHAFNIWRSNHSFIRKIMLNVEFSYQLFSLFFSWFAIGNFFLVFRLLTGSLGASDLHFGAGLYLGVVFEWLYLGCLVTCFVLSFGNRPKGTKAVYYIMVAFFAVLMVYLLFAAAFISVKAVQNVIASEGGLTAKSFFKDSVLRGILVSLSSTYILYFLSSFMFFEFGHMFHSFIQYLLISPSYTNVLNVYAFCNIHDISWGTKGDSGPKGDLGVAKTNEKGQIKIALPTKADEIDSAYMASLQVLQTKEEVKPETQSEDDRKKDYYALVRSVVVLLWMLSNFVIVAVVLQTAGLNRLGDTDNSDTRQQYIANTYLQVILWAVAGMAAIRFTGATYYLISRFF